MRSHDLGFPVSYKCTSLRCARLHRFVTGIFDNALAADGITAAQLSVLMCIRERSHTTATDLRSELHMDRSTVSKHIRWLVAHELVEVRLGADRRSKALLLTAAGKRKVRAAHTGWRLAQDRVREWVGAGLGALEPLNHSIASMQSPRPLRRFVRRENFYREDV